MNGKVIASLVLAGEGLAAPPKTGGDHDAQNGKDKPILVHRWGSGKLAAGTSGAPSDEEKLAGLILAARVLGDPRERASRRGAGQEADSADRSAHA